MTTLVLDGHPNPDSLCAALARRYVTGHVSADLISVRDLDFTADLSRGLTAPQPLEPDLKRVRAAVERAQHLVVVTPTWWASLPPMLKGLFDRVFTPGWAYRYDPMPFGLRGGVPKGLLAGRTGRVLITSDTPRLLLPLFGDHAARVLRSEMLGFCGIKPVRVHRFGGVRWSTADQRERWLATAEDLGRRDAVSAARPPRGARRSGRRPSAAWTHSPAR